MKKKIFSFFKSGGKFIGIFLIPFPVIRDFVFKIGIFFCRCLPDRIHLYTLPLFDEMGRILYDKKLPKLFMSSVLGSRMILDVSEKTQRQIYTQKIYEAGLVRYLALSLKPGDVFIDAGANVGYFTLIGASLVREKGIVIAIEPEKKNLQHLNNNLRLNGYQNVRIYECAVGSSKSMGVLNINPLNRGGNSMIPFSRYKSGEEIYSLEEIKRDYDTKDLYQDIYIRTLDDIVQENNLENVSFIKMDVEGFEFEALKGMQEIISKRKVKNVICELSNIKNRKDIFDMFAKYKYKPYKLTFFGKRISIDTDDSSRDILFSLI